VTRALVLAAHGSHLDPNASAPIWAHAERVEAAGAFDEVRVAFWKEEPALSRALDGCAAGDVTVVPVFISSGYFTEEVIPREMNLCGPVTRRAGQVIRYTSPIGAHQAIAGVIARRAREAGARPADGIAVLGHGTRRNPKSERNVFAQAERLAASGAFAEVHAVFLEQEPDMRLAFDLFATPDVVMVPLFIADGWHVGQSIPADLALDGDELRAGGRRLAYAKAAGTHESVADVILEIAAEASAW
jgi:sirohydrochlorin cobaltochelatase